MSAPVISLDGEQMDNIQKMSFMRIVEAYKHIAVVGGLQARFSLLAYLGVVLPSDVDPWKMVETHVLSEYKNQQGSSQSGPVLTPGEVLIAIHKVDPERDGILLKKVTDACTACFEQGQIFTQQVLAEVLNQLVGQIPLPLLFMRTVLQTIGVYPSLIDFVMNILSRLVSKQIWRTPKLWVGFLRCSRSMKTKRLEHSTATQYIHTLESSLQEEMSRHAPLYDAGLEALSMKELDTISRIHEGLRQIRVLQQHSGSPASSPLMSPHALQHSHGLYPSALSPMTVGLPPSLISNSAGIHSNGHINGARIHGNGRANSAVGPWFKNS